MSFVADSRYHSITISDHFPVQLDMSFPNSSVPQHSWQLDPLLLKQPSFEKFISDQIDFFSPDKQYPRNVICYHMGVT